MNNSQIPFTPNEQIQISLYYDMENPFFSIFREDVKDDLSTIANVQTHFEMHGASPIHSILDIVITLTQNGSGIIIGAMLSKIGGEIIDKLINRKNKKDNTDATPTPTPISISITTFTPERAIQGYLQTDSYETFAKALKSISQIYTDSSTRHTTELEKDPQIKTKLLRNRNQYISTVKSGIIFVYEYSQEDDRWTLKQIGKLRNV